MKHNYLNNTEITEAREKYFSALTSSGFGAQTESVPVSAAHGRVLANAVYAKICSPHYNASAMDGIAVRAKDTYGACEAEPTILSPDRYTVVDTGDPLPEDCDAVVMIEDVTEDEKGYVKLISSVAPWQNVRQVGEDICFGDMIAPTGTVVTPSLCGAFLAGGVLKVEVKKQPVFGIIPTGDEIVEPTDDPQKGEIIEFNSTIFSAMLREWKADCKIHSIVKDKKALLSAAVSDMAEQCDAVLVLAGSSAGRDDYTSAIISGLGEVIVHGVAAKPGKPAVLGLIGSTPVIGLPGYPVSAIVVMEEFVKPLIDLCYNRPGKKPETIKAVLSKRVVSSLKYKEYVRVALGRLGDNFFAVPLPRGAGIITSFTKAAGILEVPQNLEGIETGETVSVRLLKDKNEIESSLIITGSHDPIIDEIADMLQKKNCGFTVISSHVGSMGAINAIKNKQAHMGAVHLLDGETGEYNKSYVERNFPDSGAVLIKGVGRVQGLMVKKGNPLNIRSITDLKGCKYVNRQRGAGTRVLFDYLLNKYGISPEEIEGYRNELYTHTAVAALVAAGNADAGLGIYSAAKMYGLDFIPICNEEYDFLVDREYVDSPMVKAFFEVLRSGEFKRRLGEIGGYSTEG
ncbi:MAG: molybdopterin biosynthesis protein [Clostridiales bacterium]|nr:molybdopterin biosynthesis protein [Clostridiales bacterium]